MGKNNYFTEILTKNTYSHITYDTTFYSVAMHSVARQQILNELKSIWTF